MSEKLTTAQKRIIEAMETGLKLWAFGDRRFTMHGLPESSCFAPQARTVESLLEKGLLKWKPYKNDTQRECGICELEVQK